MTLTWMLVRCGREGVVVRSQPLQLTRRLEGVRDRPDPLQILALLSGRIVDLVDILDHDEAPFVPLSAVELRRHLAGADGVIVHPGYDPRQGSGGSGYRAFRACPVLLARLPASARLPACWPADLPPGLPAGFPAFSGAGCPISVSAWSGTNVCVSRGIRR